jgi:hypothetical protein
MSGRHHPWIATQYECWQPVGVCSLGHGWGDYEVRVGPGQSCDLNFRAIVADEEFSIDACTGHPINIKHVATGYMSDERRVKKKKRERSKDKACERRSARPHQSEQQECITVAQTTSLLPCLPTSPASSPNGAAELPPCAALGHQIRPSSPLRSWSRRSGQPCSTNA